MKMRLKNTSSKHRKLVHKVAAGRADSAEPTKKLRSKKKSGGRKTKVRDFLSYVDPPLANTLRRKTRSI
jgi:hypothetical protein